MCSDTGSEETLTFLCLDFENFSLFPRCEVFEVGTVFCCSERQSVRQEDEKEGAIKRRR